MKVGDLIRITKEFGKHFVYNLPVYGGCADISGMMGIYLGRPRVPHEDGLGTGTVMLSSGWICDIFEPHVWLEDVSESR